MKFNETGLWKKCIDIISFISNFCIMLPLQFYTEVTYGFPLLGSCYVLLLYLYSTYIHHIETV